MPDRKPRCKGGYRWRWRLAHHIGPVLVAAFANSPLRQGRPSGWRSTRQQVWAHLDPGRTLPPPDDGDPRDAYATYALDAELMLIRRDGGPSWAAPRGLTFRGWLRGELGSERPPTIDDLTYHLSTLFPPVRPRGHLELRMIDAQCGDGWIVPAAVAWALLEDPRAADTAMAAAEPLWAHPGDGGAGTAPAVRPVRPVWRPVRPVWPVRPGKIQARRPARRRQHRGGQQRPQRSSRG